MNSDTFYVVVTDDGDTQHETGDRSKAEMYFALIADLGKEVFLMACSRKSNASVMLKHIAERESAASSQIPA
jgi:hypothetical protein